MCEMVLISFKLDEDTKKEFDKKIKKEGRIKKITISRATEAWIYMNWGELFAEEDEG